MRALEVIAARMEQSAESVAASVGDTTAVLGIIRGSTRL